MLEISPKASICPKLGQSLTEFFYPSENHCLAIKILINKNDTLPWKRANIDTYKYDKTVKSFVIKGSYPLTTNQTQSEKTEYFNIGNNKIVLTHAKNITVVDLALKTFKISDVPAFYDSPKGVGILYDKNRTPYLSLAEVKEFWDPVTAPQLFDFSSMTTMPGVIPELTRTASVVGNCSYALVDEFDNTINVVRLYDICQGSQGTEIINI